MSDDLIKRSDAIEAVEELNAISFYELNEHSKEAFTEIRRALKALPSADRPQWIPTCDRLPNEKEVVLITNDKGNVRFGQFRGTHGKYWIWKGNTLETVLAWMPLPTKYKGADNE